MMVMMMSEILPLFTQAEGDAHMCQSRPVSSCAQLGVFVQSSTRSLRLLQGLAEGRLHVHVLNLQGSSRVNSARYSLKLHQHTTERNAHLNSVEYQ